MSFFRRLLGRQPDVLIDCPKLGFLNLLGDEGEILLAEDNAAFGSLFPSVLRSDEEPPECDVLVCYCEIQAGGLIRGYEGGLREIIRDAGAWVAIAASENSPERYIEATSKRAYGQSNLVMVLNRRGEKFSLFFQRLFREMMDGHSMPVVWSRLAPQAPGPAHEDAPETIFACEIGHVAFS